MPYVWGRRREIKADYFCYECCPQRLMPSKTRRQLRPECCNAKPEVITPAIITQTIASNKQITS